jgi:hypothetical protein
VYIAANAVLWVCNGTVPVTITFSKDVEVMSLIIH